MDNRGLPLEWRMADKDESGARIAVNRRARHDYFIEETAEAGVALQGWEVKALRAGRLQLQEAYVVLRNDEAWLFGAHVSPLANRLDACAAGSDSQPQAAAAPTSD